LKKIVNEQNNKLFRLKYILVQKYPAKVKQLFSEKDADLTVRNDMLFYYFIKKLKKKEKNEHIIINYLILN